MGVQKVVINANRKLFYCWNWGRWVSVHKLGRGPHGAGCFSRGCRCMFEPALPHLRKIQVAAAAR